MNKTAIKNFAVWARNKLIADITYKAGLIAIRFMEVNEYLPSRIRVLSSENPAKNEPDFVTTPFDTDMEFTMAEQDKIMQLKDENKLDELFRMLFIKQCNKLHEILPELFEEINNYTELLLSVSFTDSDGVVYHLVRNLYSFDFGQNGQNGQTDQSNQSDQTRLTQDEKILLQLIIDDPDMTNTLLAEKLGWSVSRVKYYIQKLKKAGKIRRSGTSRNGRWEVLK